MGELIPASDLLLSMNTLASTQPNSRMYPLFPINQQNDWAPTQKTFYRQQFIHSAGAFVLNKKTQSH